MNKTLVFFFLFFASFRLFAQDTIYLKNQETYIITKIIEVTSTEVKYKKFDYQDGPTYTVNKQDLNKIVYKNGDVEMYDNQSNRQKSNSPIPTSNIYLNFTEVQDKNNLESTDALNILRNELKKLTKCNLVNSIDDADFVFEVQVTKYMITKRKAKIKVTHITSNSIVFESEIEKGAPSEFNGFSGSRQAIGRVIKRQLLNKFPELAK